MIDVVRTCREIASELCSKIKAVRSIHINRTDLKKEVQGVVDGYFRTDRPLFIKHLKDDRLFSQVDDQMRQLLGYTHARTPKSKYVSALKRLHGLWGQLEIERIKFFGDMTGGEVEQPTTEEQWIISGLESICPTAAGCYKQAISDLSETLRLSWRGTSTELREALRELLDQLAPDEKVTASPGFKCEEGRRAPTMKQKTRFILRRAHTSSNHADSVEQTVDLVDEKFSAIVRCTYSLSSGSVHTSGSRNEVLSMKRFVDTVFVEILNKISANKLSAELALAG